MSAVGQRADPRAGHRSADAIISNSISRVIASPPVRSMQPPIGPPPLRDGGDLGVARDLTLAGLAAQLQDRFVEEAEAVQTAGRQLPAVGVDGAARRRGRCACRLR